MQEARFEKENSDETSFSDVLIAGLKNLTRLRTVKLRGKWPSEGIPGRKGSPLARSWHPLHTRPKKNSASKQEDTIKAALQA